MNRNGRPSFKIEHTRLVELRNSARLTQGQLAEELYKYLGKVSGDPRSRESSYHRIERTGNTSAKFADAIACVLAEKLGRPHSVVAEVLRGGAPEAPPNRVDALKAQLQSQLAKGGNDELRLALHPFENSSDPLQELAQHLAMRLEIAHLEQRKDVIDKLAAVTGWTVEELLEPIGYEGHWMLISRPLGARHVQVLIGVNKVLHEITTEAAKYLDIWIESDARVVLTSVDHWYQVSVEHPRVPHLSLSFSFVRCTPSAGGLSWVKPTWWDQFWIDDLERWARSNANFVQGFTQTSTPQDLRNLRLIVSSREVPELPSSSFDESTWLTRLFTFTGALDELPDETMVDSKNEGRAHLLVADWLSSGLWEKLEPHLQEFPASWWRISSTSGGILISLSASIREMINRGVSVKSMPTEGIKFVIQLAEECGDGQIHTVPWRSQDAERIAQRRLHYGLRQRLDEIQVGPERPNGRTLT